eukprot:CCRYP_008762-RC/>CCRYP_008762-RC protein AED:0.05 eAED:0.05 QI:13/1/1/1/0.75/0.6/5/1609/620
MMLSVLMLYSGNTMTGTKIASIVIILSIIIAVDVSLAFPTHQEKTVRSITRARDLAVFRKSLTHSHLSFDKPLNGPFHKRRQLHSSITENEESSIPGKTSITPDRLLTERERTRIEALVSERSKARWENNYTRADEIRELIDDIRVAIPWSLIIQSTNSTLNEVESALPQSQDNLLEFKVVITDIPRSDGGGSKWELKPNDNPAASKHAQKEDNILQLAHAALGMVVSASERGINVNEHELCLLINRAKERLKVLNARKAIASLLPGRTGSELHGRKAADAALWFAFAGVVDNTNSNITSGEAFAVNLYDELVSIAKEELLRFGAKNSCRAKDILHIIERIAMSGSTGPVVQSLYDVAADCLEAKINEGVNIRKLEKFDDFEEEDDNHIDYNSIIKLLRTSSFGLHNNRPLLSLWRFSTRQRKQNLFFQNAARHYDGNFRDCSEAKSNLSPPKRNSCFKDNQYEWSSVFEDPTRPLVVDIGCGMGVSLLGLACQETVCDAEDDSDMPDVSFEWEKCNFLGVDLNQIGIRYANGVCRRWGLTNRLKYVVDSAEVCLSKIRGSYPGKVDLVMIQFPTPFRLQKASGKGYNSQLPQDAASDGFMVTENLLSEIHGALSIKVKL